MVAFILASQSPRRRELVRLLNYPHKALTAVVDESFITNPDPAVNARETAVLKAEYIAQQVQKEGNDRPIIIGADTIVALNGRMLGKPSTPAEAREMLRLLRGREHQVHTGVNLIDLGAGRRLAETHTAVVLMRDYSDAEIDAYIASGDPMDKAGAYAIQHPVFKPVARLEGCYTGVMGLSICHLLQMLTRLNVKTAASQTAVLQSHQTYDCPLFAEIGTRI